MVGSQKWEVRSGKSEVGSPSSAFIGKRHKFEMFWEFFPNIWDGIPDFLEYSYLHIALFKQHLLELSPPVYIYCADHSQLDFYYL